MFPSPVENISDMMPCVVSYRNYECEVIMLIRFFAACLLSGMISTPALAEVKSNTDKVVAAFMQLDIDESETVSFAEYKAMVNARALTRFNAMDANRDEEISDAEYRSFWRANKSKWYRLKR